VETRQSAITVAIGPDLHSLFQTFEEDIFTAHYHSRLRLRREKGCSPPSDQQANYQTSYESVSTNSGTCFGAFATC